MIQRRQTIYMLLSAIVSALLFFMPLASVEADGNTMDFTVFGIQNPIETMSFTDANTWPLVLLAVMMTIMPIITIFKYKKRELQVRLCRIDLLLTLVFIGLVFVYFESDIQTIINAVEGDTYKMDAAYFIGVAFPLINLILQILAIRGIKKDIELLKSIDRLR